LNEEFPGDILHASAFGQHMVVINSRKIAEDLLEKRAKIYNDRPEIPIVDMWGFQSYFLPTKDVLIFLSAALDGEITLPC